MRITNAKRSLNRNVTLAANILVVCALVCITACTVRRAPGGGIQVIPDLGDNPGYGGVWHKTTVGGHCVWTNGTYCMLCDADISEIVPCSEVLNDIEIEEDEDVTEMFLVAITAAEDPVEVSSALETLPSLSAYPKETLEDVFYQFTGGLSGPDWLVTHGWIDWEEGQVIEQIPLRVNYFTDNNTPGDETDDHLDVSVLWYSKFALPDLGNLPAGVTVHAYFDGDGYDDEHDMLLLRVDGPSLQVQTALENLIEPGTCFTLEVPGAGFEQEICR